MSFRERVVARERLLGTVIACPDLALAELAASRLDFLWIDLEHSPLTVRDVLGLSIAARAGGAATLVRLARADSEVLTALLDAGVDGVIAPRVESAAVARELAAAVRYPPDGTRGFAQRRASAFGLDRPAPRARPALEPPLCFVQIESRRAVEAADAIAATAGVDGLIVGPADLAGDLGIAQELSDDRLRAAMASVQRAARAAGIVSGLAAGGAPDDVAALLGEDMTLLAYSADVRLYADAMARASAGISRVWGGGIGGGRHPAAGRSRRRALQSRSSDD
ncbi:MAG: 2-keto-3-deoxy-L-rhamnonate aldolase [Conexibacter sp.]|nr:2-keto-3-deoxy-L-rhamnonate aldolase [Conexibacter sp.]